MRHTVCSFNLFLDRKIVRRPSILGLGFQGVLSKALSPLQLFASLFCNYLAFCGSPSFFPRLFLLNVLFLLPLLPLQFSASQSLLILCVAILLKPLPLRSHFHLPLTPVLNSPPTALLLLSHSRQDLRYTKVSTRNGYTRDTIANVM